MYTTTMPGTTLYPVAVQVLPGNRGQKNTPSALTWKVWNTRLSLVGSTWTGMAILRLGAHSMYLQGGTNGMDWWETPDITTTHCQWMANLRNIKTLMALITLQMFWWVYSSNFCLCQFKSWPLSLKHYYSQILFLYWLAKSWVKLIGSSLGLQSLYRSWPWSTQNEN